MFGGEGLGVEGWGVGCGKRVYRASSAENWPMSPNATIDT